MPQSKIRDRLAAATAGIWDLDNTLYRADEAIVHAFNIAIARAAIEAGVPLPFDEAVRAAKKSFFDHGYSGKVFIVDYGIARDDLHFKAHGYIDEKIILGCRRTRDLFAETKLENALITHGAESWARRVLSHLEIEEFFPSHRVLAYEHYDFQSKAASRHGFEMALSLLGTTPENAIVIEDTADNLRIPYEMGMTTVLIHHGKRPDKIPSFVDLNCATAADFLKIITDARAV